MLKKNAQPLSEILSEFFDSNKELKTKLGEQLAINAWHELLGANSAKYTQNIYFKRGVLFVYINSAVLRVELSLNKENLIKKLNDKAGMSVVKDIIFR